MENKFDTSKLKWINKPENPEKIEISSEKIKIVTEPKTDFWQRTFYNFRNDNAPALLTETNEDFTFTVKTSFNSKKLFDQCGVIIYQDSDNWFKSSIEFENENFSRLGSVVTNLGYSDWATTDIDAKVNSMWYRLSRRGSDFLIESSSNETDFKQMRIFHLHCLKEKSSAVKFGLYACSPSDSSFEAIFDNFKLENCLWKAHNTE